MRLVNLFADTREDVHISTIFLLSGYPSVDNQCALHARYAIKAISINIPQSISIRYCSSIHLRILVLYFHGKSEEFNLIG